MTRVKVSSLLTAEILNIAEKRIASVLAPGSRTTEEGVEHSVEELVLLDVLSQFRPDLVSISTAHTSSRVTT